MKPWIKTTIILLVGFLLGAAAAGFAFHQFFKPHHPPGAADADRVLNHLDSKLGFTDDQKQKVALLLKQELPKADALRSEGDAKFQALRDSFNSQLRLLLNPDQQKKYADMVAKWEERRRKEQKFFGCGAPVSMEPVTGR